MKLRLTRITFLPFLLLVLILTSTSCKKDKLDVNVVKEYSQIDNVSSGEFDGGWNLTLRPDGVADVLPGGDISYRGTFKINGSKIKVITPQNSDSYTFEIISDTEIEEKKFGVFLRLKQ